MVVESHVCDRRRLLVLLCRDNANVGYMYGTGVILSTHNGGLTWLPETPNLLIKNPAVTVIALATGVWSIRIPSPSPYSLDPKPHPNPEPSFHI